MVKQVNPAVAHWVQAVKDCLDKWGEAKSTFTAKRAYFDFDWHPDHPPPLPFRWTMEAALFEMRHAYSGLPNSLEHETVISRAAMEFMDRANSCLAEWDRFVAEARADLLQLWDQPQRRGAGKAEKLRLRGAILELLRSPDPDATRPPAVYEEIWRRIDAKQRHIPKS